MYKTLSPKLYDRYKEKILGMSNSFQRYEGGGYNGLSDGQIAKLLGLTEEDVTYIRCVAELETPPLDNWQEAIHRKLEEAQKFIGRRNPKRSTSKR